MVFIGLAFLFAGNLIKLKKSIRNIIFIFQDSIREIYKYQPALDPHKPVHGHGHGHGIHDGAVREFRGIVEINL